MFLPQGEMFEGLKITLGDVGFESSSSLLGYFLVSKLSKEELLDERDVFILLSLRKLESLPAMCEGFLESIKESLELGLLESRFCFGKTLREVFFRVDLRNGVKPVKVFVGRLVFEISFSVI